MEPEQRGKESDLSHPRARDLGSPARRAPRPRGATAKPPGAPPSSPRSRSSGRLPRGRTPPGSRRSSAGWAKGGSIPASAGAAAAHVHAGRVLRRAGGADAAGGGCARSSPAIGRMASHQRRWADPRDASGRRSGPSKGTAPLVSNAPAADVFVIVAGTPEGAAIFALDRRSVAHERVDTGGASRRAGIGSVTLAGVSGSPAARLDGEESRRFLADIQNTERGSSASRRHGALRAIHAMATDRLKRDAEARATQQHRIALADLEDRRCPPPPRGDAGGALGTSGEVSAALRLREVDRDRAGRRSAPLSPSPSSAKKRLERSALGPSPGFAVDAAALRVRVGGDGARRDRSSRARSSRAARLGSLPGELRDARIRRALRRIPRRDRRSNRARRRSTRRGRSSTISGRRSPSPATCASSTPSEIGGIELEPEVGRRGDGALERGVPEHRVEGDDLVEHLRGGFLLVTDAGAQGSLAGAPPRRDEARLHRSSSPLPGSDFGSCRTTATRANGRWTVRGEKATVTNGPAADVCPLLHADGGGDAEAGLVVIRHAQPSGVSTEAYDLAGVRGCRGARSAPADVRGQGFEASDVLDSPDSFRL